jgi:hypothetical protein
MIRRANVFGLAEQPRRRLLHRPVYRQVCAGWAAIAAPPPGFPVGCPRLLQGPGRCAVPFGMYSAARLF